MANAIAVTHQPLSMNHGQYRQILHRLEDAGQGAPDGRRLHVAYGTGNRLRVFDIWDSQHQFDTFGPIVIPILHDILGPNIGALETFQIVNEIVDP
jgi:hypothetical protein